jgi:hypothetical protein
MIELPTSGWKEVPREVVRSAFPEWEFLLERGWAVLVNEQGLLSWQEPLLDHGVCAFCGERVEMAGLHGKFARYECSCGAVWYQEIENE